MAIEDVLNRIAAGGWARSVEEARPSGLIPPPRAASTESLGGECAPVDNIEAAKEWALRVLSDESTTEIQDRFGGDFEPAAGMRYRLVRDPGARWADRCPQGHIVGDRLWLRQCVAVVCTECEAVYDPSECVVVPNPKGLGTGKPVSKKNDDSEPSREGHRPEGYSR